jgi:hypothetical protein
MSIMILARFIPKQVLPPAPNTRKLYGCFTSSPCPFNESNAYIHACINLPKQIELVLIAFFVLRFRRLTLNLEGSNVVGLS